MRALAPIYSHRVPGFKKTQIGFDLIQKRNPNLKRKVKTRLSVDRPVDRDRPMPRSTAPVDRAQPRLRPCQSVDRAVDRFLPRLTGRSTGMFRCMFVHASRSSSRPWIRVCRPPGRPTDAFWLSFWDSDSFSVWD